MTITRRDLVRGLGAGILGVGALSGCTGKGGSSGPTPTGVELEEPEGALVIGQIGAGYGRMAVFEEAVAVALDEARIDVNGAGGGLFGKDVEVLERHVMQEPGEDLTEVIGAFREAGATCVITSIDEESLIAAMPALVEAEMAVIDIFTSGMSVRDPEVQTANLLMRLSPNDRTLAAMYAENALGADPDDGRTPGTVAYLSEDTAQGRSLRHELEQILVPHNGGIVSEHFYPVGDFGDAGKRVEAVLKKPPALLVFNGGQEAAPFLSALYEATLDEGKRPKLTIPSRLAPAAVVDYAQLPIAKELLPECLVDATGYEPGGEISELHELMMLNRSTDFLRTGYAYSQQAYDALVLACLAAQHSLSLKGTALAAGVPAVLTGSEECTDFEGCRRVMTTALEANGRATVSYTGRMGAFELGPQSDARTGDLREYSWSKANELETPSASGFEDAG